MESKARKEIIEQHLYPEASRSTTDEPPQKWQLYPEIPLAQELTMSEPPALPQIDHRNPMSKEEYLEAQYRLHRYEATEMLRRAIAQYRQDPFMLESDYAHVYTEVRVQGYLIERTGPACRITYFSASDSLTDRLTPGSLVVLSPRSDHFQTRCLVATVAHRPDAEDDDAAPPTVTEILWAKESDAVFDPDAELVMLEPKSGYFEPTRYIMAGLQHAASFQSRFDKYIFPASQDPRDHEVAAYVQQAPSGSAVVPENAEKLDPSQRDAFRQSTSQELAIVQGPPGTGKTFTSIVAIESYVKTLQLLHKDVSTPVAPPVIIATQTNHAVDQILDHCISMNVGTIARLGGGSQDEKMHDRTVSRLRHQSRAIKPDKAAEAAYKLVSRRLRQSIQKCFPGGLLEPSQLFDFDLITREQYDSLVDDEWETAETQNNTGTQSRMAVWLDEYVRRGYFKAPQRNRQQGETEPDFVPIERCRPGYDQRPIPSVGSALRVALAAPLHQESDVSSQKAERLLARHSDLFQIKPADRGAVYRHLCKKLSSKATVEMQQTLQEFNRSCDKLKAVRWENSIKAIHAQGVQILGCTTTGLVKYRGLLAALKPRILLIEEAAEAREANIAAALLPSLEQLVLVGDHQQLVPPVEIQELCLEPHRLNVSLFERLVNIKVPYCTLRVQRRMIPSLREVVQVFYPNLEDHDIVKNPEFRPPVPGMGGCNLWWFQHQWAQTLGMNGFSYSNRKEADMIVGFVRYLVQNGVSPDRITVLAYYNGQVDLIRSILKRNEFLVAPDFEWSVRTIDSFQGEENDIILLSLVRGPDGWGGRAMPGFLADENRAVVATSRARCCFYIFGNAENVLRGNLRSQRTWEKVFKAFEGRTGKTLPITCSTLGQVTHIYQPDDWRRIPGGGHSQCNETCATGYPYTAVSHPPEHEQASCTSNCPKTLACSRQCDAFYGHGCECSQRGAGGQVGTAISSNSTASRPGGSLMLSRPGRGHDIKEGTMPSMANGGFIGYQTSDDLMDKGARSFFSRRDVAVEASCESHASESDVDEEMLISFTPTKPAKPCREGKEGHDNADGLRPAEPRILDSFRRTTVDERGVRRMDPTAESEDVLHNFSANPTTKADDVFNIFS